MSDSETKTPAPGVSWLHEPVASRRIFTVEQLSEEQQMFGGTAADFGTKEVLPKADELDEKKGEVAVPLMRKAGELGLLAVDVPEQYEGLGLDKVTTTIVTEKISEFGTGAFATVHGAHTGIGTLPLVYFGTEEQKKKYLPGLASGETIGCYCLTEAGSGSDALAAKTKAILSDDGAHYILNGEKMFITNAAFADIAFVFAKIDGQDFTGFIVEMDWEGVSTGTEEKKMGILGSSTRTLILDDVKVPKENLLFEPGRGHVIAFNILNIGRYKLGAAAGGAVKQAIRDSAVYANQRRQFQTPIGTFRAIRQKLADMFVKSYAVESMSYRTAGLLDEAIGAVDKSAADATQQVIKAIEEYAIEASIMKVWGSEAVAFAVDEAVQIHGGYGYIREYAVERGYRDARINRIFEGTNEINRLLIPGTLLKRNMKGQVPLMPRFGQIQRELAEGAESLPASGEGPLAAEIRATELAKRAVVFTCGHAIRKYLAKLSKPELQMVLLAMADLIMEAYALDSVVVRTSQFIDERGLDRARIPVALARVFVAECVDKLRAIAGRLLANCLEEQDLEAALGALIRLLPFNPLPTYGLKDELAAHLLEREAHSLE